MATFILLLCMFHYELFNLPRKRAFENAYIRQQSGSNSQARTNYTFCNKTNPADYTFRNNYK